MSGQKLVKVDATLRRQIQLTTDTNRRMAENHRRELARKQGPNVCTWCGAEPCGHLWTRPGDEAAPGGERCCDRCSHAPVEGWRHTHTAWAGAAHYPVCAVRMQEGDVLYMRRDGVIQWLEMQRPVAEGGTRPVVAFLGDDGGTALYTAGEGDADHTNLWEKRRELDVVWLAARAAAAVAADETRKAALQAELERDARAWQEAEDARRAAEKAKLEASIEKRAIVHESRLVLDELGARELDADLEDEDEDEDESATAPAEAQASEPVRLTRAELQKPVPVKAGPGRPKRSWRQRRARERQKRAWVRQEAMARVRVKRLQRTAREADSASPEAENLVKKEGS
jgi:hypothetical protein